MLLLPIMNGKTIYLGCLADLDTAIEMFQKEQGSATASLAVGDIWNGGSVDKWLKLAYLLKARYINKLIKKGEGSYLEGKYDAAEILACLDKLSKAMPTIPYSIILMPIIRMMYWDGTNRLIIHRSFLYVA